MERYVVELVVVVDRGVVLSGEEVIWIGGYEVVLDWEWKWEQGNVNLKYWNDGGDWFVLVSSKV